MIEDAKRIPDGTHFKTEVCVIGGGPAGIALTGRLTANGRSVILVESGNRRETAYARDLNRGLADPPGSHEPLEENRRRQWGGASTVWGGRCTPLDPLDFEKRSWVPRSGWPIGLDDLAEYYPQALDLCQAGPWAFSAREGLLEGPREMIDGLDGDGITTDRLERWSPPTDFARTHGSVLAKQSHVQVLLNATCTHIHLAPDGTRVIGITIMGPERRTIRIRAKKFILAAGGLENPRILLASNDIATAGIGNQSDHLGRNYMIHVTGNVARIETTNPPRVIGFERDAGGVYCRRRIWFDPELQERAGLLNTVFFSSLARTEASGHRSALFSTVYLAKLAMAGARHPSTIGALVKKNRSDLGLHARTVLKDLPNLAPEVGRIIAGRYLSGRRLPMILPPEGGTDYAFRFQAEQIPNPESRLSLDGEVDATGMPRIVAKPRLAAQDMDSVIRAHALLAKRLESAKLGRLVYEEQDLVDELERFATQVNSSAHHLGTTRMSSTPSDGVVDVNSRVHGVGNLYVTGGSVFPTGGHANPTLTIVALALRLADHLVSTT